MTGTMHIVLAMKPCEGNFIENALKHGVSGLNIAEGRIAYEAGHKPPTDANMDKPSGYTDASYNSKKPYIMNSKLKTRQVFTPEGRFPANVVLGHSEGCVRMGVKRVKGIGGGKESGGNAFGQDSGWNRHDNKPVEINRQSDSEGKETVDAWDCVEGCPVRAIDGQSGLSGSNWRPSKANGKTSIWGSGSYKRTDTADDSGGASRFFKQVREWLEQPT
jgi:hypothetical protein